MRHPRKDPPSRPWTPEEDERLAAMLRTGLASEFWHLEFPDRRFGELTDRRLDLGLPTGRVRS